MNKIPSIIYPVLIADVGGTNARFAYLADETSELNILDSLKTADFLNIDNAIEECILPQCMQPPQTFIIAWAGPIEGNNAKLTNSKWFIDKHALAKQFNFKAMCLLNDFEAQAIATTVLSHDEMQQIGQQLPFKNASRAILGPGTGLGVAGMVCCKNQYLLIAGEGGHINFALNNDEEFKLFDYLPKLQSRLSAEEVLSGRGLWAIYNALCHRHSIVNELASADQISAGALNGTNALARQAVEVFLRWLARIAGDIALIFKAKGGVYIGGGIVPRLLPLLNEAVFRHEFENKAPHQKLMQEMPLFIIKDSNAALVGMAGLAKKPEEYLVYIDCFD